ncbi:MAG TPA: TlpA disulfide reductase family protein [Bacteroidota bacterium]|nr:TlpA disulfide reductase family protein [Bacteroidota bacterium]
MNSFYNLLYLFLFISTIFFSINIVHSATIEGNVRGADGKPMALSHVDLRPLVYYDTVSHIYQCDKNGYFKIETQDTGFVFLKFSGAYHRTCKYPIYISDMNENIKIDCQLGRNFIDTTKPIYVLGNFNKYKFYDTNYIMKKIDNEHYYIEINLPQDTLKYQIVTPKEINGEWHSINGTMSDYFERDRAGDYYSIYIDKNPTKKIILDTKYYNTLGHKDTLPKVKVFYENKSKEFAQVCEYLKMEYEWADRMGYFMADSTLKGASAISVLFGNKIGKSFQKRLDTLDSAISRTNYYPSKMLLYMEYFNYAATAHIIKEGAKLGVFALISVTINDSLIRKAMKTIPPLSPLWIGFAAGPEVPIICSIIADGLDSSQYFDEFADSYPISDFRRDVLIKAYQYYDELNINNARKKQITAKLLTDFPNDWQVYWVKEANSSNKKIKVGKQVPKFKINDIDTGKLITKQDLMGKYTLIDFWATWCGPCVQELPNITNIYNKYKDANFQIISISFDVNIEKVKTFRAKRYAMPWINAVETKGFASEIAKDFEIISIPRPILVGPDGSILAVDIQLRNNNLEKTLEMYLGK